MKTEDALKLARELIIGPRAKTYGDKIINHANIAKLHLNKKKSYLIAINQR